MCIRKGAEWNGSGDMQGPDTCDSSFVGGGGACCGSYNTCRWLLRAYLGTKQPYQRAAGGDEYLIVLQIITGRVAQWKAIECILRLTITYRQYYYYFILLPSTTLRSRLLDIYLLSHRRESADFGADLRTPQNSQEKCRPFKCMTVIQNLL